MHSVARDTRYVAWPAYLVALALILIPLADAWTSLYPWRFGSAPWRFGAVGLISNALLLPVLGFLVLLVVARMREQRTLMRVIAILGFLATAILLLALVSFALDSLQTRAQVRPEMRMSFNVASITAAFKTLIASVTFLAFGICGWRLSKAGTDKKSGELFALPTSQPLKTPDTRS